MGEKLIVTKHRWLCVYAIKTSIYKCIITDIEVHFRTNSLGKDMKPLIHLIGKG